jgi:uncharacterized protein (UPF0276 family)
MIQLGCNYSEPLFTLLRQGEVAVDWIKLARVDTLMAEVARCKGVRPALVHTLGKAGWAPERFAQIDWAALNEAITQSESPHVAIHLQTTAADWGGAPSAQQVMDRLITQIEMAKRRLAVPLLLENVPDSGTLHLCVDPERITELLVQTETNLLLDTAHLRCAAFNLRIDPRVYALALPLERVREIHVAGPRMEDGVLQDRHTALQEADYDLLDWLLPRTHPLMVTLEYGGTGPAFERPGRNDLDMLRQQLQRLRGMLRS